MITHIQFKHGYALKLPCVQDRVFKFTPGINILFGPNGCGKSTIIKTLKAYCGIQKGGWTQINDPTAIGTTSTSLGFPMAYAKFAPGECYASVGWTGNPTFFNDGDIKVSETFFFENVGQSEDGITTEREQMEALMKKPSSGQYRIDRLNKVLNLITTPPVVENIPDRISRAGNQSFAEREKQYLHSLGQTGPLTILLDEPERSLSLPKQKQLLCEAIPKQMGNLQVIIATHSVFALEIPGVNIIDMEPGYVNVCKEILNFSNTGQSQLEMPLNTPCSACEEYKRKLERITGIVQS